VAVPFFGDGASNEGAFHESINLAAVWKLPVVFLCENNQYAVTSSFKKMVAVENIADRSAAYNIPGVLVDGQDVLAVYETASQAAARARAGQGPSMIEAKTYRFLDHSQGLDRIIKIPYRTQEEIDQAKLRDPIDIHRERLLSQGVASQEEIDQVDREEAERIGEAAAFARESPWPDPSEIFDDMYASPIPLD
jgi:pyruvate dehydrogenase E1 component alpha subunit